MSTICRLFGRTRQGWYKRHAHLDSDVLQEAIVVKHVKELRTQMPGIGGRKLQHLLNPQLQGHGINLGRDKLFDILADNGLLINRRKRRTIATTNSDHPFKKYPNIIRNLDIAEPCRVWVSDITYISLQEKYCYLSLITDAYSRKIMGYCLLQTLKKEGPLNALEMALSQMSSKGAGLIHHSDRGIQYCCHDYIEKLNKAQIAISMTEKGDPYENAIAERVNGILKTEFHLGKIFDSFEQASQAVNKAIAVYNQQRPHASIDYLTPDLAHQRKGRIKARWKSRKERIKERVNIDVD